MKVHPIPKRRNISIRSESNGVVFKKLRRLPHVFARVLELPFHSDAEVSILETPDSLLFSAATDAVLGEVRADPIEIYPGVVRVVIRGTRLIGSPTGGLDLDMWRFRLPESTRPELASASFRDGELVVTIPKGFAVDEDGDEIWGEGRRVIVVQ